MLTDNICIVSGRLDSGHVFEMEVCPDCAADSELSENVTSVLSTTTDKYQPVTVRCEGFKRVGCRTIYCDKVWK